jgi:hypothetical protein
MADPIHGDPLLLALRNARPPADDTESASSSRAQALLNALLSAPSWDADAAGRRQPTARQRRRAVAISVSGAAALAAIAGTISLAGERSSDGPASKAWPAPSSTTLERKSLHLAGYVFVLPPGYEASTPCQLEFTPPPDVTAVPVDPPPVFGGDAYAHAASADGGCIDAALGTGYPADAQPVQVGRHAGFLWRTDSPIRGKTLTLCVILPPSDSASVGMDPGLNLILTSTGLTAAQLKQIAETGLND